MNSFLSACGLDDSLQFVISRQGEDEPWTRLLRQPFAIVGSDPEADLVLSGSGVVRRHFYLQVIDGWAFWVDLEKAAGQRKDTDLQTTGWLEGDEVLSLSSYTIRRSGGGMVEGDARRSPPRDNPLVSLGDVRTLPETSLEFLNGPSRSTTWPMRRVMSLVGSAAGCKFRLTDPSVSRFHAALLRTAGALWIVDLLGRDGVRVNGERSRVALLQDGDELRIGRYRMRVHRGDHDETGDIASIRLPPPQRSRPAGRALSTTNHADRVPAAIPFSPLSKNEVARTNETPSPPMNLEVIATPPGFSIEHGPAQHDLTAAMLVPLVNQFGQMQQQMFDQFQQAMGMMVRMFGEMHRDQMEVIRGELDRLRELTDEFHALKEELAARTRADLAREVARAEPQVKTTAAAPDIAKSSPQQLPPVAESPASVSATPSLPPLAAFLNSAAGLNPTTGSQATQARPTPAPKPAAPTSDRETVAWLHQRIASLQQERETRWQKLLKLLPGVS